MPNMYIIAGPNGAGKTTAAFNILPDIIKCKEFVNAHEIATGISPFNPEAVFIEASKIMLNRVYELLDRGEDFAFETTLATKSYKNLIALGKKLNYEVILIFLWLNSPELAVERVKMRVMEGGHEIDEDTIVRRYINGARNLKSIYMPIVDYWMIFDNSAKYELIAEGAPGTEFLINNADIWEVI